MPDATPVAPVVPAAPADRYASADDVRAAHAGLLEALPEKLTPEDLGRVAEFLRRAAATGAVLDAPEDRKQVQGLIDYWSASLSTAAREVSDSGGALRVKPPSAVLARFATDTVGGVATAADRWLAAVPAETREETRRIANRVLLRLVRMSPEGDAVEFVPVTRGLLAAEGPQAVVDAVIEGLAGAGALEVTRGPNPADDRVALRYEALTRTWGELRQLVDERRKFRDVVRYWARTQQNPAALLTGPLLDRVWAYHDPNPQERAFLDACRGLEHRQTRNYRLLALGFAVLALVALVFAVVARRGWNRVTIEHQNTQREYDERLKQEGLVRSAVAARAEQEKTAREMIELDAAVQSTSTVAIASMLLTENESATHSAKKVLIIQALRQVLFARNRPAFDVARRNLDRLRAELTDDRSVGRHWFKLFFEEVRDNPIDVGHRTEVELITGGPPLDDPGAAGEHFRRRIDALREISTYLRRFIVNPETAAALATIRPVIVEESAGVARKLADHAASGKPLAEARPYQIGFWQLDSTSLAVTGDTALLEVAEKFAAALRTWEDAGGPATDDVRRRLGAAAGEFEQLRAK
jgi:hypothetical protein